MSVYFVRLTTVVFLAAASVAPALAQQVRSAAASPTAARTAAPAPAQQRQLVPKAQFLERVAAEFAATDSNKDNKVTKAELEQHRVRIAAAQQQQRNRVLFANLDTDKNGALSTLEFARLTAPTPQVNVAPLMTRYDINRDQQLTLVEYRAGAQADFERLDTNNDGMLAPAEARAGQARPAQ